MSVLETDQEYRRRESRLRAKARRQGMSVVKSRINGQFMLVDNATNFAVAGAGGAKPFLPTMDLSDMERYLSEEE